MTKETFISYVQEFALPLFTGSYIVGEEKSTNRDSEVALGNSGTVLIKAHKNDEYRLIIKRSQPFKVADVELIREMIVELEKINSYQISDKTYIKRLQTIAMEKAICKSLTEVASETLLGVINELDLCGRTTYEGNAIQFGVIINEYNNAQNKISELNYKNLFKKPFFMLLSNGIQSCIEIDKEGYLIGHALLEKLRFVPTISPYDYSAVAKYCSDKRIGVILLKSGDIMVFKNHQLAYSKKRGIWGSYCHDEIIQLLSNRTTHTIKEIRKAIYFTALDCSFAASGGCIVYLNKGEVESALNHIDIKDIIEEKYFEIKKNQEIEESRKLYNLNSRVPFEEDISFSDYISDNKLTKSACINECVSGRKFHELNRKLRQEIVSMDGATIVDYDGTIIATGAIVKIEAGSSGGGRLAATQTLAKYGVAIKISVDGMMQAFTKDRRVGSIKPIFSVG